MILSILEPSMFFSILYDIVAVICNICGKNCDIILLSLNCVSIRKIEIENK